MSLNTSFHRAALALILVVSACGDDNPAQTECGAGTMLVNGQCVADAECGAGTTLVNGECIGPVCGAGTMLSNGMCVADPDMTTYRQVEQLGRPGIAEALLITPAYLEGYNATAPSFAGAPAAAVTAISAEAKTVLKAIFHGTCLLNGLLGFTAVNGAIPGGVPCGQVGGAVFTGGNALTGTVIDPAQATAATTYADRVFGQFITDVLRIDTAQTTQGYFAGGASLCSPTAASGIPLLCGGRLLNEDVIDITYFYLIAGAAVPTGATIANTPQVVALVTDGVFFSGNNAENSGIGLGTPDINNRNQFHQSCPNCGTPVISTTFPYSAAPR
jgi:hypothetical protein